jgi:hypothetical protein
MQTKDFALDLKEVGEDGTFVGYGSVFGNADSYGEIVEQGEGTANPPMNRRQRRTSKSS